MRNAKDTEMPSDIEEMETAQVDGNRRRALLGFGLAAAIALAVPALAPFNAAYADDDDSSDHDSGDDSSDHDSGDDDSHDSDSSHDDSSDHDSSDDDSGDDDSGDDDGDDDSPSTQLIIPDDSSS